MKLFYVDENCVLDLSQIISYNYDESEVGRSITVSLSNGLTIEANDYFERSKKLFDALLKWHNNLLEESADGIVSHST